MGRLAERAGGANARFAARTRGPRSFTSRRARPRSTSGAFEVDAVGLLVGQVDPQLLGRPEHLVVGLGHLDGLPVGGQHLHVETQRLELLEQHLERFRNTRLGDVLALDDGLVDLHTADHVVGLDRQQLLQGVGRAVGLHGPALHLTEALAAELGLAAERLLGDHRVRAGRAGVDLVVHHVVQLHDVHVADADRVRERLTGASVEQVRLAGGGDHAVAVAVRQRVREHALDLFGVGAVEDRRADLRVGRGLVGPDVPQRLLPGLVEALQLPAGLRGPAEVDFEDLTDVHSARYAHRVEQDVDRRAVGHEGHVLLGHDLRDDALVAVAAGELVAHADLPLLRDVDADHLVDARGELVAVLAAEGPDAD